MHNELDHRGARAQPLDNWVSSFAVIFPLVSAYRQHGGRDRSLPARHPFQLRVPIAPGTPTTVWHWCLMRGLPCQEGKRTLRLADREVEWLPDFQARYGANRPLSQPFSRDQSDPDRHPDDPGLSPDFRRSSNPVHMYAFPFGREEPQGYAELRWVPAGLPPFEPTHDDDVMVVDEEPRSMQGMCAFDQI